MIEIDEHLLALLFGLAVVGFFAVARAVLGIVFALAWRQLPAATADDLRIAKKDP